MAGRLKIYEGGAWAYVSGGSPSLTSVVIDAAKDWNAQNITNMGTLGCGAITSSGTLQITNSAPTINLRIPTSSPSTNAGLYLQNIDTTHHIAHFQSNYTSPPDNTVLGLDIRLDTRGTGLFGFASRAAGSNTLVAQIDASGNLYIGSAGTATLTCGAIGCGAITTSGTLVPSGASTLDLGSTTAEWANLYIGTGKIYFDAAQSVNLYGSAANVLKTDDALEVGSSCRAAFFVTNSNLYLENANTTDSFGINFNSGEFHLYRSGAMTLKTDATFDCAALLINGTPLVANSTGGTLYIYFNMRGL